MGRYFTHPPSHGKASALHQRMHRQLTYINSREVRQRMLLNKQKSKSYQCKLKVP
jgi:hypothetical protein